MMLLKHPLNPKMSLNNYQIKVLATILMLVDHVGVIFFPDLFLLRAIGRFSFPLFALLLSEGEKHTRKVDRYCFRLLLLGILSQPIYQILFNVTRWNILFTLFLGLVCLRLARMFPRWQLLAWAVAAIVAQVLDLEYGAYGIGAIALVNIFQFNAVGWAEWIGLHSALLMIDPGLGYFQIPAIFSPFLFRLTNHQPGKKARWFYLFYPVHLLALWLIRQAIAE
jgi:TraX protein